MPFELPFSVVMKCLKLGLDVWSTCMLVGRLPAVCQVLLYGRWCLHTFYGIYGGKEMTNVLRTVREL